MMNVKRTIGALACAAAGVFVGSMLLGEATASDSEDLGKVNPGYEVNEAGQSFGSSAGMAHDDEPDLIEVIATNGAVGYVEKADLYGIDPESPAEAVASTTGERAIPVYESDGSTVVGEFIVQGGDEGVVERDEGRTPSDEP